jgi:hypothetical protein
MDWSSGMDRANRFYRASWKTYSINRKHIFCGKPC